MGRMYDRSVTRSRVLAALIGGLLLGVGLWLWLRHGSERSDDVAGSTSRVLRVGAHRLGDRARHAELLDAIRRARAHAPQMPASWGHEPGDAAEPVILPHHTDYARAARFEIMRRVIHCDTRPLDQYGNILLGVTIEADDELGGVISNSVLDRENSTVTDPELLACIESTMYDLVLDPPPGDLVSKLELDFKRVDPSAIVLDSEPDDDDE